MKLIIDEMIVFTALDVMDAPAFGSKLKNLLRNFRPRFLWVDNTVPAYKYWILQAVPAEAGIVSEHAKLGFSGYTLIVHKGAIVSAIGSNTIEGFFTFSKAGYSYVSKTRTKITIHDDGTLEFKIVIDSMRQLDIGIKYFSTCYDGFLKRNMFACMYSPAILLEEEKTLCAKFSPICPELSSFTFDKAEKLSTCFTTKYGKGITMCFQDDFSFVFQKLPSFEGMERYYLSLKGKAEVVTDSGGEADVILGISGAEYIRAAAGTEIYFEDGNPAFFENVELGVMPETSYIKFPDMKYFSQPQEAYYYSKNNDVYEFAEMEAGVLKEVSIPVFPYENGYYPLDLANQMEMRHLTTIRHERMHEAESAHKGAAFRTAITRHGMKAFIKDGRMRHLRIAADKREMGFTFTELSKSLMLAFLSSDLFLALHDRDYLQKHAGTSYMISEATLAAARGNGYPDTGLLEKLIDGAPGREMVYYDRSSFIEAVKSVSARMNDTIEDACDNFIVDVNGFKFLLSPRYFNTYECVLVIKLNTKRSLAELIEDSQAWSFPSEETEIVNIKRIIKEVAQKNDALKNRQLDTILNDRNFKGVVGFNCGISAKDLPTELGFLSNGIDAVKFKALFLAFPVSTAIDEEEGNISALIDYRDETHQFYEDYREFAFKVLLIQMEIINKKITNFNARIELLINRLFNGETSSYGSECGNNIVFNGSYQGDEKNGMKYVFMMDKPQIYTISNCLIENLTIDGAALQTDENSARFLLDGKACLSSIGKTDLLSYDQIPLLGIAIDMKKDGDTNLFSFTPDQLKLDAADSPNVIKRKRSFANHFPVVPTNLFAYTGSTALPAGYTKMKVKGVTQEELADSWYGIEWEITIGDLGGLAGSTVTQIRILTAWSRREDAVRDKMGMAVRVFPKMFIGIRLHGSSSQDDYSLPLQGVMSLGFDAIELKHEVENEGLENEKVDYYFQFKNFALKILGIRFPNTNNAMYLIADEHNNIGWYGSMGGE